MTALYNDIKNLPAAAKGCVIAIGNFDGVHLGHAGLIQTAREIAAQKSVPCAVLTFEPHPRRFFQPDAPPFLITLLQAKQRLLDEMGVDHLFVLPFDRALSQMTGGEFVQRILKDALHTAHVVVGEGFAFGRNKSGNVETLSAALDVTSVAPVRDAEGTVVSSTRIREHLRRGELDPAAALLGRAWELEGPVIHGDKRGRTIGFPTANQNVTPYVRLPYGIYAVRVRVEDESAWRGGAANYGIRPMFETPLPVLETHIFDFNMDIYGKNMQVCPVRYLRPEMNFGDIEALTKQIRQDCLEARAVLQSLPL